MKMKKGSRAALAAFLSLVAGQALAASTMTLPGATTAYTAGQLISNNPVVPPSFAVTNQLSNGSGLARVRLSVNDATSTAWGAQQIQVDLWTSSPTFSTGDRTTWALSTGSASHLGSLSCTMSAENGDGAYAECAPSVGNSIWPKLQSGALIYWTLQATTGSGVTGASKVFTLTPELVN